MFRLAGLNKGRILPRKRCQLESRRFPAEGRWIAPVKGLHKRRKRETERRIFDSRGVSCSTHAPCCFGGTTKRKQKRADKLQPECPTCGNLHELVRRAAACSFCDQYRGRRSRATRFCQKIGQYYPEVPAASDGAGEQSDGKRAGHAYAKYSSKHKPIRALNSLGRALGAVSRRSNKRREEVGK